MLIDFDPDKYYIVEKVGKQRNNVQVVSAEEYSTVGIDKEKFESYIKRNLADKLLIDYEGGIKEGELYLMMYDKVKTDYPFPETCSYELRIVPVNRINPLDLKCY